MNNASKSPGWLNKFVQLIFDLRYVICLTIVALIVVLGFYLSHYRHWGFKDVSQVCTEFLLAITLFFTALNYEFTTRKTKNDAKATRDTLTYNIAAEWHKSPMSEYQKVSIAGENLFAQQNPGKKLVDFKKYIDDPQNLDFKESVKGIFNYFESIGVAVSKGLVDKDLFLNSMGQYFIYTMSIIFITLNINAK